MTRLRWIVAITVLLAFVVLAAIDVRAAHMPIAADLSGAVTLPEVELICRTVPTALPTTTMPEPIPPPTPAPTTAATVTPTVTPTTIKQSDIFMRVVAAEGGQQYGYDLAIRLAQVTVNQARRWGISVDQACWRPGNYSVVSNGMIWRITITPDVRRAVTDALNGIGPLPKDCLYYCTLAEYRRPGSWHATQTVVEIHSGVVFFR